MATGVKEFSLVLVPKVGEGFVKPRFGESILYGYTDGVETQFVWVDPSGNVDIPEYGMALTPGWRFATEEDNVGRAKLEVYVNRLHPK